MPFVFGLRLQRDLVGTVPHVYVPQVHHELTRRRVMTMEWIDGVKLSSYDEIERMGFSVKALTTTAFKAFAHQIFLAGCVHGDPHPGLASKERGGVCEVRQGDMQTYAHMRIHSFVLSCWLGSLLFFFFFFGT